MFSSLLKKISIEEKSQSSFTRSMQKIKAKLKLYDRGWHLNIGRLK